MGTVDTALKSGEAVAAAVLWARLQYTKRHDLAKTYRSELFVLDLCRLGWLRVYPHRLDAQAHSQTPRAGGAR